MALIPRNLTILDWKTPNTNVGGHLVRANRRKFADGGSSMQYLVKRKDGSIVAFPGATQLDMCLHRSDLGAFVQIIYVGEDNTRQMAEGRSKPKLFNVSVDEDNRIDAAAGEFQATDEDIPF